MGEYSNLNQRPSEQAVKSKLTAGLLGIFLGELGIHRFYLGYVGIGIIQILVTSITFGFGGIWGVIEGILILTGSMNKDAQGRPLRGSPRGQPRLLQLLRQTNCGQSAKNSDALIGWSA